MKNVYEKMKIDDSSRESAKQWQATFDAIKDAVCILNPDGIILRCNQSMSEFLGKPPGEILGRRCWQLVHCMEERIADCPVLRMRGTRKRETLILPIAGKWFEVIADPIFDQHENITEAVHIITDITQRKQAEEKLETYNRDLEKRIQARTIELSSANTLLKREVYHHKVAEEELQKALEKLKKTKNVLVESEKLAAIGQLVGAVAHEIMNPINIISLRIQVLKMDSDLPDHLRHALHVCEEQIKRIANIIQDLGRYSRLKKKEVSFLTNVEIHEILEHILNRCAPKLKEQKVKVRTHYSSDLPPIPLDTDKMEHILINIISNSIAAVVGQSDRTLDIRTRLAISKESVQIVISAGREDDTDGDLDEISDVHCKTKVSNEETDLGLLVAYSLIDELGGKIYIEKDQNGAMAFVIELSVTPNSIVQRYE